MSSGSERDRPCGIIVQGNKVVGAICIPDTHPEFIDQFNNCYGPLRMRCSQLDRPADDEVPPNPHRFKLPAWFRHVWQPAPPPAAPAPKP
ncbi:MAG: hypothetical protein SGI77_12190 [Pirellulaceae bacterium]|nr:hypothetical protein [Pirellulaceae bacterium]